MSRNRVALILAAAMLCAAPVVAGESVPLSQSHAADLAPLDRVPLVTVPSVDRQAAAREDAAAEAAGLPPRFAMTFPVSITPAAAGLWERLEDGREVWRLRVSSVGAHSLNLGFTRFRMPEGGSLFVLSADGTARLREFNASDNAAHGELWTPVLRTDAVLVEVDLPAGARDAMQLALGSVNAGYRGFGAPWTPDATDSGSCNVDVVCPEGDGWRSEIPSVARITIGGGTLCTGFMVNNTARDQKPLFMTARHCGLTSTNAATLVAYWNYETTPCGGTPNGSLADNQTGAFWRASSSPSDFTLVELDSNPDPAWQVTFAGWDHAGADATSATAIHHPQGDEKRISFENQATMTTSYLGNTAPGDGTHVRVVDWDTGTTEGGSSGSPLFDQNHHVIGQLHGGYAACGNNSSDWYGKFAVSWTGGGTSTTRLSDWLDPAGTGAGSVDTLNPSGGCQVNGDCDDGLFCNGAETCAGGSCASGANPCPGQGCDEIGNVCTALVCDGDTVCESGENCTTCAADCISGTFATCGNHICERGAGEDCLSCPSDCNGNQGAKPSLRYCCGDGAGTNPVGCGDARCTGSGNTCSAGSGTAYCCGDGTCSAGESSCSCALDCGAGVPETGANCSDGRDNDCDGQTDCADSGCASAPACQPVCQPLGATCSVNSDCCSNRCRASGSTRTCK